MRRLGIIRKMTAPLSSWHSEVSGSGSVPLVCVHGWCCEGGQFAQLAAEFAPDFRVFRPDLPGHGGTPLSDFQPGFVAYAEALAGWIAEQNLDRPVLLGHSMGGVLALMTAARVGARAVINLDGSLPAAPTTLAAQATIRGWLDLPDFRQRLANALRDGFFLAHERDSRAEAVIRHMCAAPEAVLRFLPETIGTLDASRILPEIEAPVLYIGAEKPRFDGAAAQALRPGLCLDRIPGAGHFLQIFAPKEVAARTKEFLSPTLRAG
jgi:pimeloyl-ACP methyl ester carboxylesterase